MQVVFSTLSRKKNDLTDRRITIHTESHNQRKSVFCSVLFFMRYLNQPDFKRKDGLEINCFMLATSSCVSYQHKA